MKYFIMLNGAFYILFGLYWAFMPKAGGKLMGWEPNLLGLHELRAFGVVIAALGALHFVVMKDPGSQPMLVLAIIIVTMAFAAGRFLGLLLDGKGPRQTYAELGIEAVWIAIGLLALQSASP